MFNNKLFWSLFMMPGAILGWIFTIFGFVCPIENETLRILWIVVACIFCIGHPVELLTSIPIGKKAGISTGTTVLKTLIFGFTWWVPVKMGVLDK